MGVGIPILLALSEIVCFAAACACTPRALNAFARALDGPDENSRRSSATSDASLTAEASGRSSLNSFQRVAPPSLG